MVQLLTVRCLRGLSKPQLVSLVGNQIQQQKEHLRSLRLRHHGILKAYEESIDFIVDANNFGNATYTCLSKAFNTFIAEGSDWKGKELSNNLDGCVNEIAYHCVNTIMLAEILAHNDTVPCEPLAVRPLLLHICEDVGALSKEKFGVIPAIRIEGDLTLPLAVSSLYEYVLVEIIKNAIESVVNRYGALSVEDVDDSIVVTLQEQDTHEHGAIPIRSLKLVDRGGGMSSQVLSRY